MQGIFMNPAVVGEAMWKNALVEGVEEVTEQVVLDATKGIVDTMSYLGLTKKQGSLGGWNNIFSKQGFENYLANFVGGIVGGGLFEFHRSVLAPWIDPSIMNKETQKSLYELIAAGHKDDIIDIINSKKSSFGNNYVTPVSENGEFKEAGKDNISQADLIAEKAIEMVNIIDGILNSHDLIKDDSEIINKAIRDKIIIDQLNATKPENSTIGLEGLVLEDYKSNMVKIVELESQMKNLTDSVEDTKIKSLLKSELKNYVDNVNLILEGKKGVEYLTKSLLYLVKDVHSPFLKISKPDFVKETYNVNYFDLPTSGIGLTKERMDKE